MIYDIFDIEEFVKLNYCPEVTNPMFFQYNKTPTPDGLFSYELFGYSEEERSSIFGYIDLKGYYINPVVYTMISTRMSTIGKIIRGEIPAEIKDGKIVPAKEEGPNTGNGLEFIYDNFDKINWITEVEEAETASLDRKTRLKFLQTLKRDEFFVSKLLVIPPYYREESSEKKSLGDVINQLYKDVLLAAKNMGLGFTFDVFGDKTKMKIQEAITQIYRVTMGPITGKSLDVDTGKMMGNAKNSMIKRHGIGKNLDYGANTVIVAPQISDSESPDKTQVPFGYTGVTLVACIGLFKPFFINHINTFLTDYMNEFISAARDIDKIDKNQFSNEKIDKLLTKFVKSNNERFDLVEIKYRDVDGDDRSTMIPMIQYENESDARNNTNPLIYGMTYTDLIYMAALDITKNKHVIVTRHPVFDARNIYPSKIKVLSTARTREVWGFKLDNGKIRNEAVLYDRYPYIDQNEVPAKEIAETMGVSDYKTNPKKPKQYYEFTSPCVIGNIILPAIGGDYDGDTVFLRGLFSTKANAEADKLVRSKNNLLAVDGEVFRSLAALGKDCVSTLYVLTKE